MNTIIILTPPSQVKLCRKHENHRKNVLNIRIIHLFISYNISKKATAFEEIAIIIIQHIKRESSITTSSFLRLYNLAGVRSISKHHTYRGRTQTFCVNDTHLLNATVQVTFSGSPSFGCKQSPR
jgi:hypothetical protein